MTSDYNILGHIQNLNEKGLKQGGHYFVEKISRIPRQKLLVLS